MYIYTNIYTNIYIYIYIYIYIQIVDWVGGSGGWAGLNQDLFCIMIAKSV